MEKTEKKTGGEHQGKKGEQCGTETRELKKDPPGTLMWEVGEMA